MITEESSNLVWPELAESDDKARKENLTYFLLYRGVFEQLVCPHRGAFAGLFLKNSNPRCSALVRGGEGGTLLEMTDALSGRKCFVD